MKHEAAIAAIRKVIREHILEKQDIRQAIDDMGVGGEVEERIARYKDRIQGHQVEIDKLNDAIRVLEGDK